ncbi:glycoside hydrolase family 16 protein [Arthrobacter sp. NPDC056727]|uniref:glycoside hydrolase family 16 protein n=1 Tax=Arthrobacter sp. NPDC056727 TaxID=3345927 RepID=UPI00366D6F1D
MVNSAHGKHRRRIKLPGPLGRVAVLAAVVALTVYGTVATEAQRPPEDRTPAAGPSGTKTPAAPAAASATPVPSPAPSQAAGTAKPSPQSSRAAPSSAPPPSAAAPPSTSVAVAPPAPKPLREKAPAADPTLHQLPTGDLPGWKQVFREDFDQGNVPVGGFPGPAYAAKWSAGYKDGTPDTAGQQGKKSGYYPSKVLSVQNGMLDWYLHSEDGVSMGAAPTPKIPNSSTNPHRDNSFLYGRFSVRFRADSLPGFKTAWLLWPDSGIWPRDGELDYPEGDLATKFYGAVHKMGNDTHAVDIFYSNTTFTGWHVATMEWSPGKVEFFLDGRSLGAGTSRTPNVPMHYILQTESCLTGCPKPATAGHVYLDWIAIWKRA